MISPTLGNIKCSLSGTEQTFGKTFGTLKTCFCEDYCTWKKCKLNIPPVECLPTESIASKWVWDLSKSYWVAQVKGIDNLISLSTCVY